MIRLFGRKKPDAPAERGDGAGRRKGGFTAEELARIDDLSAGGDVNIWRGSTEDAGEG